MHYVCLIKRFFFACLLAYFLYRVVDSVLRLMVRSCGRIEAI